MPLTSLSPQNEKITSKLMRFVGVGQRGWRHSHPAYNQGAGASPRCSTDMLPAKLQEGTFLAFLCVLYKNTHLLIWLGLTLEKFIQERWKTKFFKDWTIHFYFFSGPRSLVIVKWLFNIIFQLGWDKITQWRVGVDLRFRESSYVES